MLGDFEGQGDSVSRPTMGINGVTIRVWGLYPTYYVPRILEMASSLGALGWVLPPLTNSWIRFIKRLNIALNRTPNMDCCRAGQYPT